MKHWMLRASTIIATTTVLLALLLPATTAGATKPSNNPNSTRRVDHALATRISLLDEITCGSDAPTGAICYNIPDSIDDTCSTDDTVALYDYFYSILGAQNGTDSEPVDIEFTSDGCYLIQGMEFLRDFTDWVFNGNGSKLKRTDTIAGETTMDSSCNSDYSGGDLCLPLVDPYCGDSGNFNTASSIETTLDELNGTIGDSPSDPMFFFEGGCDIVWNNFTMKGPDTTGVGGDGGVSCDEGVNSNIANCQQDSFTIFAGTKRVIVQNCTMTGPNGDYVDEQGLHEAAGTGGGNPGTNVTVTDDTVSKAGRDGFSQIQGDRFTIEDVDIAGAADAIVDLEDDTPLDECTDDSCGAENNITFDDNDITSADGPYTLSGISDAPIENLQVQENDFTGGAFMRIDIQDGAGETCGSDDPVACGYNVAVNDNTTTTADSINSGNGFEATVTVLGVNNVVAYGNTVKIDTSDLSTFFYGSARDAPPPPPPSVVDNAYVANNVLTAGTTPTNQTGESCGDETPLEVALDAACSYPDPPAGPPDPTIAALPHDYEAGVD